MITQKQLIKDIRNDVLNNGYRLKLNGEIYDNNDVTYDVLKFTHLNEYLITTNNHYDVDIYDEFLIISGKLTPQAKKMINTLLQISQEEKEYYETIWNRFYK